MRVIEQEMNRAIKQGIDWSKDNTQVEQVKSTGGCDIYLHGNHIATVQSNGLVLVMLSTLRDYPTNTTKSRLRALGVNVYTKKGMTYLDGNAIY